MDSTLIEYARAIDELDIVDHLRITDLADRDRLSLINDAIFKSIFYSKPNSQGYTARFMLSNGHVDRKDSELQDYIQLLNISDLADYMSKFYGQKISADQLLEARNRELEGAVGMYSHDSFRAWRVKVGRSGLFISPPETEVKSRLEEVAGILNREVNTDSEAIVNAADFFLKFIRLHPFDEGNGRTGRIITNTYLLEHGLNQMIVTSDPKDKDANEIGTDIFSFSGQRGPYISWMLASLAGGKKIHELAERLKAVKTDNPYAIELRDTMLWHAGEIERGALKVSINKLYWGGRSEWGPAVCAALWLSRRSGIDSPILLDALNNGDDKIRAVAVFAMEAIDFEKYRDDIKRVAFAAGGYSKTAAIGVLGKKNVVEHELMSQLFDRHENSAISLSIGVYLRNIDSPDAVETIRALLDNEDKNLRVRGYHAAVAYGSADDVIDIIERRLNSEPNELKKATLEEISRTEKINSSDEIVESLIKTMKDDGFARKVVLGELSSKTEINALYIPFLEDVLGSGSYDQTDKTFATYLVGREKGFAYLKSTYGLDFEDRKSTTENVALALVYANDLKSGRMQNLDGLRPLNDEQYNFAIALLIAGSELGKAEITEKLTEIDQRQQQTRHSDSFYNIIPSLIKGLNSNGAVDHSGLTGIIRGMGSRKLVV